MNSWKGKRVFITGCNGFVGGWLIKVLTDNKADVVGLIRDKLPRSSLSLLGCEDKLTVVDGDVEDYGVIERTLNEYNIEVCFHLAAQSQVGVANRSPVSTIKTNIIGTINILEAARNIKSLQAIVIASSDKAYGFHEKLPYKEDFALRGTYPYDASKACADILSQSYFNTYALPVAISRCGNIFGPYDLNMNRIIPDIIRALCAGSRPIIRSDGKYVRDYIFVLDAVSAYLTLGKALIERNKNATGKAFNFGTGKPVSVLELVNAVIKISGKKVKPEILNTAKSEIRKQYLSNDKARAILGWRPRYSLESALKETYRWYEKFFEEKI